MRQRAALLWRSEPKSGEQDGYKRIAVSGIKECMDVLRCVSEGELHHCLLELEACTSGCVNGPVSGKASSERFKSQMLVQGADDEGFS